MLQKKLNFRLGVGGFSLVEAMFAMGIATMISLAIFSSVYYGSIQANNIKKGLDLKAEASLISTYLTGNPAGAAFFDGKAFVIGETYDLSELGEAYAGWTATLEIADITASNESDGNGLETEFALFQNLVIPNAYALPLLYNQTSDTYADMFAGAIPNKGGGTTTPVLENSFSVYNPLGGCTVKNGYSVCPEPVADTPEPATPELEPAPAPTIVGETPPPEPEPVPVEPDPPSLPTGGIVVPTGNGSLAGETIYSSSSIVGKVHAMTVLQKPGSNATLSSGKAQYFLSPVVIATGGGVKISFNLTDKQWDMVRANCQDGVQKAFYSLPLNTWSAVLACVSSDQQTILRVLASASPPESGSGGNSTGNTPLTGGEENLSPPGGEI